MSHCMTRCLDHLTAIKYCRRLFVLLALERISSLWEKQNCSFWTWSPSYNTAVYVDRTAYVDSHEADRGICFRDLRNGRTGATGHQLKRAFGTPSQVPRSLIHNKLACSFILVREVRLIGFIQDYLVDFIVSENWKLDLPDPNPLHYP